MTRYFYIFFVLIFIPIFSVYGQEYYFYHGKRIDLTPRTDKIACVFNSSSVTTNSLKSQILSAVGENAEIKETGANVLLIVFESKKSVSAIDNLLKNISTTLPDIKFVTRTYFGESKKVTQVPTDEFIVRLKNPSDRKRLEELNGLFRCKIIDNIKDENGFLIKTEDGVSLNALQLSQTYFAESIFEYAHPNFLYTEFSLLHYEPNDTYYSSQWALKNTGQSVSTGGNTTGGDALTTTGITDADMDVNLAWDYATGTGVKVGVIDTGIDSTHPDFAGQLLEGYDAYYNYNSVKYDSGSHGTATAGLIGAVANNSLGVAGIAYNSKIMSIRIFNASGSTTDAACIRAFDTARVRGLDVLSNSWGGGTPNAGLTDAINNAALNGRGGKGCIILFSSGNDGRNPPSYPSYLSNVICIGASTTHDQKKASGTGNQYWWGGNYGEDTNGDLECVAPTVCYTVDVQSTRGYNTTSGVGGNYYANFNGTSCSCPNAAGVAALILSINTSFTRSQVTEYLLRGCEKIDRYQYNTNKTYGKWNEYTGYGRVDAYNSVRLAAGVDVTPPSINHKIVSSHSSTRPTLITAEITDQDGAAVPTSGVNRPRLFYRINKNEGGWSAFDTLIATSNSGNNFYFHIPCQGYQTEVQYYILARDNSGNEITYPKGAPDNFWLCYFSVGTFTTSTAKNTPFTITTSPGLFRSAVFSAGNFIMIDAKAKIYLTHTYVEDILVTIYNASLNTNQNRVCLFSHNGGSGDNITGATVTDAASTFWRQSAPAYTGGTFLSEYNFDVLKGNSANGDWRILVYDSYTGDGGSCDSVVLTFTKLSGSTSASIRLNNPSDSTIDFGIVNSGQTIDYNFYVKNSGTSVLNIDSIRFTGTYGNKFSIVSAPSTIAAGDSGLFIVRCSHTFGKTGNPEKPASMESGIMNIYNNDPSKQNFQVTLYTENPLPVKLVSFTAKQEKNNVILSWKTSNEIQNFGWEIERSLITSDKANTLWEKIGFVHGSINSNSEKSYSFTDKNLKAGKYYYRLKEIDIDGNSDYSDNAEITIKITPANFALHPNYPNPFNPTTEIKFEIPTASRINISVYNVLGELITTLIDEVMEAGIYEKKFDASGLPSGTYIYKLQGDNISISRKMQVIK